MSKQPENMSLYCSILLTPLPGFDGGIIKSEKNINWLDQQLINYCFYMLYIVVFYICHVTDNSGLPTKLASIFSVVKIVHSKFSLIRYH